jgi:uncharacterized ion transporter superfamily protein YfcC
MKRTGLRLPHPILLLLGGIVVAALLTWVLPAGEFQRRDDPVTGRSLVVAGTYHHVAAAPVGAVGALLAVPRGIVEGAEVVVVILLVGGAFALVERRGILARGVGAVTRRSSGGGTGALVVVAVLFAAFGALENMQEEIIALVPVLLVLGRGLGFDALTMVAASFGAAAVGSAFGPTNPFQAAIALKLAQLPLLTDVGLRIAIFAAGLAAWIAWTLRHARAHRVPTDARGAAGTGAAGDDAPLGGRDVVVLLLLVLPILVYVVGVLKLDWGFNELSALFFVAALVAGIVSGLGASESVTAYVEAMQTMVGAALLVGVARGISVVLTDGRVIDTIVSGLAAPLSGRPPALAAVLMVPIQALIHLPVPSVSGQAALTLPILVPLSDLLGLSRTATVLAYQTGAGLAELLVPTNAAMMAILLTAGVPYTRWISFAVRGWALLTVVGIVGIVLAAR